MNKMMDADQLSIKALGDRPYAHLMMRFGTEEESMCGLFGGAIRPDLTPREAVTCERCINRLHEIAEEVTSVKRFISTRGATLGEVGLQWLI